MSGGYNGLLRLIDPELHKKVKRGMRLGSKRRTVYFIKEYPELFQKEVKNKWE